MHGTRTVHGWFSDETNRVAWRKFREHGATLLVANTNRSPAEQALGCDIIFYNVTRHSLVLVRYKKLDAERGGFYYPNSDRNLAKELVRMRSLDRYAEMQAGLIDEQRLDPSPSWIELCHPRSVLPHTTEMIHGMYFSRRQFESLCDDDRLKDAPRRRGPVRLQEGPGLPGQHAVHTPGGNGPDRHHRYEYRPRPPASSAAAEDSTASFSPR
ncbi:hypothetical protein [Streptomyces noursei]|uniref:hypothetical protein n=1 Tax=Streptomyces noursei TaxID=1971 RepID=UPI00380879FB